MDGRRPGLRPRASLSFGSQVRIEGELMAEIQMIEFMVTTRRPGASQWEELGARSFRVAPRRGEWIDIDGRAYEVLVVVHPPEPAATAGDILVRDLGKVLDVRRQLFLDS